MLVRADAAERLRQAAERRSQKLARSRERAAQRVAQRSAPGATALAVPEDNAAPEAAVAAPQRVLLPPPRRKKELGARALLKRARREANEAAAHEAARAKEKALQRRADDAVGVFDDAPRGVHDRESLTRRLMRARADGVPHTELADAYPEVEDDIADLVARRCVVQVWRMEPVRGRRHDDVLYANPSFGTDCASRGVCRLWASVEVPPGRELRAELLRRKVRTQADYDARDAHRRARREAQDAARRAEAEANRRPAYRKSTNVHLRPPGATT